MEEPYPPYPSLHSPSSGKPTLRRLLQDSNGHQVYLRTAARQRGGLRETESKEQLRDAVPPVTSYEGKLAKHEEEEGGGGGGGEEKQEEEISWIDSICGWGKGKKDSPSQPPNSPVYPPHCKPDSLKKKPDSP